jgi:hypothetical protein
VAECYREEKVPPPYVWRQDRAKPVEVYKAARGFADQYRDMTDWRRTEAAGIVREIEQAAIQAMADKLGYEAGDELIPDRRPTNIARLAHHRATRAHARAREK